METRRCRRPFLFLISCCLFLHSAMAAEPCEPVVGQLVSVQGAVDVQRSNQGTWQSARLNESLCQGDTVRVGEHGRAAVSLINDAVLRIDQNTTMRLVDIAVKEEERSWLDLIKGVIQSFSRKPRLLSVNTPYLNGSIEGTEFVFRVEQEQAWLTVFEGTVVAANDKGSLSVTSGGSAVAVKGQAPQPRTLVRPRDQVQWALYYPPILATDSAEPSPELKQAADLLNVGRVDEARKSVEQAIAKDTDAGLAYALRAVISIAQNRVDDALQDSQKAVELSPTSSAAKIALSYAQQADLDLEAAWSTLKQAVTDTPEDPLALARLAELHLMLGENRQATETAAKATAIAPDLARTQLVLGFAALSEFDTETAMTTFGKAIELDSADPLARLGLGLAKIRKGELAEGRRDIEAAIALDSNNALLRSYLGKAYFEEKRSPLDAEQLAIAKELDPKDPTAYLYDGIRKQTENDPVGALKDLRKSTELNDNRAVYRSQLLLDKDRASRGTSMARVYNDLGFSQLGINESTQSLSLDPANASAHRFLSDTYRNVRRREISRVSELLQAQMLQDININPVQPSVSATSINIVTQGGPASAGFNEFTSLFERNQAKLDVTAAAGNNDTITGEAVASGLYDRLSLSAGAFYHDTDGFRTNNDLRHNIYDVYAQIATTPRFNLQAEFAHRETDNGDLTLNFDPDDFDSSFDREFDSDTFRLGARFSPNVQSNLLVSYIYSDREDDQIFGQGTSTVLVPVPNPAFPPVPPPFFLTPVSATTGNDFDVDETSHQYEAAYLFNSGDFNITAGLSYAEVEQHYTWLNTITFSPLIPPLVNVSNNFVDKPDIDDARAYLYGNFSAPSNVHWTLGLSYQDYDEDAFDVDRVNPKAGVQWDVTENLRLRGAYFKVIKPALASNRTLEPTQVAGFNQLFDDSNGTKSTRYAGALDWQVNPRIFLGAELSRRDIESPEFTWASLTQRVADYKDWDEWDHRAYAYWTPTDRWSLGAEAAYSKWEGDDTQADPNKPLEVRTISFPLKAQYFHPSGFFAGAGITYVDQEVERSSVATFDDGDSDFVVADLALGYRLPKRRGIVSLSVQNLFDEDFDYQDDSFRTFEDEPTVGPYIPERHVVGSITLNF